ncbi:hypothetical protein EB796_001044 [Bugula neritina]|uniref:Uncharacterized protein n=1 Tax=Bugula neritina TaxID=10212 RepID=A0A7J7KR10_BUGNE|nr:hypothetical protein EB796_001044 [Bugula neritina]
MFGTVQQKAYLVPTTRRKAHPSQKLFDSTTSLTVRPMTNKKNGSKSDWKNNYGRACWTADNSRYISSNSHNSFKDSYGLAEKSGDQTRPSLSYSRSYTTVTPKNSSYTLPSTASLPKTGQVKLTSLHDELAMSRSLHPRAKTVGSNRARQSKLREASQGTLHNKWKLEPGSIGDITLADLHSVINTEFPVSYTQLEIIIL